MPSSKSRGVAFLRDDDTLPARNLSASGCHPWPWRELHSDENQHRDITVWQCLLHTRLSVWNLSPGTIPTVTQYYCATFTVHTVLLYHCHSTVTRLYSGNACTWNLLARHDAHIDVCAGIGGDDTVAGLVRFVRVGIIAGVIAASSCVIGSGTSCVIGSGTTSCVIGSGISCVNSGTSLGEGLCKLKNFSNVTDIF